MRVDRVFVDSEGYQAFYKDPDSVLDYKLDLSRHIVDGDSISTATVAVEKGGVTVDSSSNDANSVTVWLSGDPNARSDVRTRIVTSGGRTADFTFRVYRREK